MPMKGEERRKVIMDLLKTAKKPISGSEIASRLDVSRQVIVQDIALLRAQKNEIMATARGYLLYNSDQHVHKKIVMLKHTKEQIFDELQTIVDLGGRIVNVIIEHPIYEELTADLMIESRKDIQDFMDKMKEYDTIPLMHLTNGFHMHQIEAKTEDILDQIEQELEKKGYLIKG